MTSITRLLHIAKVVQDLSSVVFIDRWSFFVGGFAVCVLYASGYYRGAFFSNTPWTTKRWLLTWRLSDCHLFVRLPPVCTTATCLYDCHLFVRLPRVCTTATCLYDYHVFIRLPPVCTTTTCLYDYHVFIRLPPVCTTTTCLYEYHVLVRPTLHVTIPQNMIR